MKKGILFTMLIITSSIMANSQNPTKLTDKPSVITRRLANNSSAISRRNSRSSMMMCCLAKYGAGLINLRYATAV